MNKNKDSFWLRVIYIVSCAVSLLVAFLILGPRPNNITNYNIDVSFLPLLNASLNFSTVILLVTALYFVKNKKILGIHFRGTDQKTAPRHPLPATKKQMTNLIDSLNSKHNYDKIFLATEEKDYHDF